MSAQDRQAEREVADFYDEIRSEPEPRTKGGNKRFAEAVFTGFAVGRVLRKIF